MMTFCLKRFMQHWFFSQDHDFLSLLWLATTNLPNNLNLRNFVMLNQNMNCHVNHNYHEGSHLIFLNTRHPHLEIFSMNSSLIKLCSWAKAAFIWAMKSVTFVLRVFTFTAYCLEYPIPWSASESKAASSAYFDLSAFTLKRNKLRNYDQNYF